MAQPKIDSELSFFGRVLIRAGSEHSVEVARTHHLEDKLFGRRKKMEEETVSVLHIIRLSESDCLKDSITIAEEPKLFAHVRIRVSTQ